MKIQLSNGHLFIDDKEVLTIVFVDGETQKFPIDNNAKLYINEEKNNTSIDVFGNRNIVISGKNIVTPGSTISVKGDFRIGDG